MRLKCARWDKHFSNIDLTGWAHSYGALECPNAYAGLSLLHTMRDISFQAEPTDLAP